jgi:hypothetical protein
MFITVASRDVSLGPGRVYFEFADAMPAWAATP